MSDEEKKNRLRRGAVDVGKSMALTYYELCEVLEKERSFLGRTTSRIDGSSLRTSNVC